MSRMSTGHGRKRKNELAIACYPCLFEIYLIKSGHTVLSWLRGRPSRCLKPSKCSGDADGYLLGSRPSNARRENFSGLTAFHPTTNLPLVAPPGQQSAEGGRHNSLRARLFLEGETQAAIVLQPGRPGLHGRQGTRRGGPRCWRRLRGQEGQAPGRAGSQGSPAAGGCTAFSAHPWRLLQRGGTFSISQ